MFRKILIANRGEIAVRIIKACREMGIKSAAIYSDADKYSLHVRLADESYYIGSSDPSESYLNSKAIISLAKQIDAEAIHPGYGFLAENGGFISDVEKSGLIFIGPTSKSVKLMGNKSEARKIMIENSIPVIPGSDVILTEEELLSEGKRIGYPIIIKAEAGGGGKGMRRVFAESEAIDAYNRAKIEAKTAFGNDRVYIEKLLENPKHIEVQLLADKFGNIRHLFERDCSLQRKNQKIIEETPSILNEKDRKKLLETAVEVGRICKYENAGTVEFLVDSQNNFFFMEMNTRIQVEHPITEMITGVDLVKSQIKIAYGERIDWEQSDLQIRGHSIECRITAEDTINSFSPSIGTIKHHRLPSGAGIRIERGIEKESEITMHYDSLLSKVISYGANREEAISKMEWALENYQIAGVITNIPLHLQVLRSEEFGTQNYNINTLMAIIGRENFPKKDKDEEAISVLALLLEEGKKKGYFQSKEIQSKNSWKKNE